MQVTPDSSASVLQVARNTVDLLNNISQYKPGNGFCLAWPAAVRVAPRENADMLIGRLQQAYNETRYPNGYPNLGGGGLEQIGALDAVYSLLIQARPLPKALVSQGVRLYSYVTLFPVWPEDAPASFERLRLPGSFIISASWVSRDMGVTLFHVESSQRRHFVFESPFVDEPCVRDETKGTAVEVRALQGSIRGLYVFTTEAGALYDISGHC
jgi:hypothetical protein